MSTMELAAWCRWGLLLALLPSGAVGTQGGSGEGRARSGDATLQPGAPRRSLRAGGGQGGTTRSLRSAVSDGPGAAGSRPGRGGGPPGRWGRGRGRPRGVLVRRLVLSRLRQGSGNLSEKFTEIVQKVCPQRVVLHGACVCVFFPFLEPLPTFSKPFQLAASASRLDWAGFLGGPCSCPSPCPLPVPRPLPAAGRV